MPTLRVKLALLVVLPPPPQPAAARRPIAQTLANLFVNLTLKSLHSFAAASLGGRPLRARRASSSSQVQLDHPGIAKQIAGRALVPVVAGLQNVSIVGHRQRQAALLPPP